MNLKKSLLALLLLFTASPALAGQDEFVDAIVKGADAAHVAAMIRDGADPNWQDINGQMPLTAAAYWSEADVVRLLLDKGANVEAKAPNGVISLMQTDAGNKPESIRRVLERGVDLDPPRRGKHE